MVERNEIMAINLSSLGSRAKGKKIDPMLICMIGNCKMKSKGHAGISGQRGLSVFVFLEIV